MALILIVSGDKKTPRLPAKSPNPEVSYIVRRCWCKRP